MVAWGVIKWAGPGFNSALFVVGEQGNCKDCFGQN